MKLRPFLMLAAFSATAFTAAAQQPAPLQAMVAARNFRQEMAQAVAKNEETPEAALKRLRSREAASGLSFEREADAGYAALDVGHRLMALDRPDAAEAFFRASEEGFEQAMRKASRGQSRERAAYLQKLAHVRGNYLNKADQALADIEEAIRLQPDDHSLKNSRGVLTRGRGEQLKQRSKN
jgi:hypothetical protein